MEKKEKYETTESLPEIQEKFLPAEKEVDKLVKISELAEKRALALKKIRQQALKVTNKKDWININGKPYLQTSGAEKIATLFGISWRFLSEPEKISEEDGHYRYEVEMEFKMGDSTICVIGSRSTKDTFFTTRYTKNGEKYQLPPSELDAGDILKAAITNAVGIGITRILGIRNLSWEDLKETGIDTSELSEVSFKDTTKKSQVPYDFLKKMTMAKEAIEDLTGSTDAYYEILQKHGYSHANEVKPEEIDDIYKEMKKRYLELKEKAHGKTQNKR